METSIVKMEPQAMVKIEPQDIKTEPDCGSPKKKKSPGRPKKLKQEKITDHITVKKKRDRFKGMSEDEVAARLLPDHLAPDLDIVIIGINPGLFAAFIGHHYAGPGNHFWKCMYLSGLIPEPMNAMQDFKLLDYGIGFTNIVARTTRGSADLTKKEIKEGAKILTEKLNKYKPKIAVFNGKGIYEVFVGHKDFYFGKQPDLLPGTQTAVFVMPSSSARCSQLPRAVDKVPFYEALKKFRDHLNGKLPNLDDSEICFPDLALKTAKKEVKKEGYEDMQLNDEMKAQINNAADSLLSQFTQGNFQVIPHTSASDISNSPVNGLAAFQVKQEPQDSVSENQSIPQIKQEPKDSETAGNSGSLPFQIKQEPQDSVSVNQSDPVSQQIGSETISLSQTSKESRSQVMKLQSQDSPSANGSYLPSLSSSVQQVNQAPQENSLPNMPPLQQFVKVKQEPEEYRESSCMGSQSNAPSYPQYLNIDQSDPAPQNGITTASQVNSFLQGMYGMVNKVANQEQSNYGMVSLMNKMSHSASHPLQFNQALCDIVRDGSCNMEAFAGVSVKKEIDVEKTAKPKSRKRKSNSKPVSTVTSSFEENEESSNSSSGHHSQDFPPSTLSKTYPHFSTTCQSNPVEKYPHLPAPLSSHNVHNIYSHQNYSQYPSITTTYQQYFANGNHYQQSDPFSHSSQSFSQMMAQDPDLFRPYQYGTGFHHSTSAPNLHAGFPSHPYSYSQKSHETSEHATNTSKSNGRRMSADTISSQASNDLAVDLRQALDRSSSQFEADQLQASERHGNPESKGSFDKDVVVKQEKMED